MNESAPLAYEETKELIRLAQQGDEAAQERLTVCNTALVKSIVKRYMNRHVEYDDLFQIGCMGLVKAIQKFHLCRADDCRRDQALFAGRRHD